MLLRQRRSEEACRHYGLRAAAGATNLAVYRALVCAYPDRDRRGILLDLIEGRGEKGKWFAAAKHAGFLDVALDRAAEHSADPATLVRAARDFSDIDPRFATAVGFLAVRHLLAVASRTEAADWARQELDRLAGAPCAPGRKPFRQAVRMALSRPDA